MPSQPISAEQAYAAQAAIAEQQLQEILKLLADYKASQAKDPKNWGYVGDLHSVNRNLSDVAQFLRH
jgi:hypothetical protein